MPQITNKLFPVGIIAVLILLLVINLTCKQMRQPAMEEITIENVSQTEDTGGTLFQYGICIDTLHVNDYTVNNGDHMGGIFARLGFSAPEIEKIIQATSGLLDPTKLRAGMNYTTFTTKGRNEKIRYMAFARSAVDYTIIDLTEESPKAYEFNKPVTLKRSYSEGILTSSLWNAIKSKGGDPLLALKLSDVFAWQIDFFDVKEGDSFQVLYDVAYIDDTTALNIAAIKGAIFTHKGKEYAAIPFEQDSVSQYFDEEGNSLRKAFLKAPLDFFRITSRFSNSRFHPVLKKYRAHHGVDYAAPVGTPVKSIGDGTVIAKGYESGGGNYLKVKHNAVYTTTYMHLSKFASGVQVGSRVKQGEVIAYVGSTGLSTGPHLDFRVHKNGQPIDPLQMEAPPSEPIKAELTDSFSLIKHMVYAELDSFRIIHASREAVIAQEGFYNREGWFSSTEHETF